MPAPTLVYFHGGGWVAGDLNTHDRQARLLAIEVGAVVLSVDYRRPPEAKFPAAFDDSLAATFWAAANIAELGGDPARLGVAGDSAGRSWPRRLLRRAARAVHSSIRLWMRPGTIAPRPRMGNIRRGHKMPKVIF